MKDNNMCMNGQQNRSNNQYLKRLENKITTEKNAVANETISGYIRIVECFYFSKGGLICFQRLL